MKVKNIKAHCDIPCAVYDPAVAQYAALSVLRFLDLIGEMPENINSKKDLAHLTRLVQQKEEHAKQTKNLEYKGKTDKEDKECDRPWHAPRPR